MGDDALETYLAPWRKAEPACAVASLFLRPDERVRFGAFAALQREWLKTAREVGEPQVAAAKLGWWREEVERALQGQSRHPLAQSLFADPRIRAVPAANWTAAIDAASIAIVAPTPADFTAQRDAVRPLAEALAALEARVWFGDVANGCNAGEAVLCSLLVDDLRAVGVMAGNGHSPLPMSLLARHGLTIDGLARDNPARRAAVRNQVGQIARALSVAATMQARSALFRAVRVQHDLDALRRAESAEKPLEALTSAAPGFRNLLKTWRAARIWRAAAHHETTP